jgi:hypothetical protein
MRMWMRALMVPGLLLGLAACDDGPAERTGERLDRAGERLRDTVDPPSGPAERVGRSLDRAVN